MNTIFVYFKDNPIKNILDLCNEFTLQRLMLSIEPSLPKVELNHGSEYKIKHNNFSKIMESFSNYLTHNPDRIYFTPNADFISKIKIDGIIKCQKEQAILLGEMLLFLSSISKNKESFDKVDQCTNESLSLYVSIQEKYTTKFSENEGLSGKASSESFYNNENEAALLCEKLKKGSER